MKYAVLVGRLIDDGGLSKTSITQFIEFWSKDDLVNWIELEESKQNKRDYKIIKFENIIPKVKTIYEI